MKVIVLLLTCIIAVLVEVNGFYGSEDAEPYSAPYIVNFRTLNSLLSTEVFCGGVIITKNIILTTTLCIQSNYENITVTAGDYNVRIDEITEQKRQIIKKIAHPNHQLFSYNFALLHLNESLEFNDYVQSIALPENDENFYGHVIGFGWGRIMATATYPDVLQRIDTTIIERDVCKKNINPIINLDLSHICTSSDDKRVNMLLGDQGGPLIKFSNSEIPYLVGIMTTAGMPSSPGTEPMVHGNVAAIKNFLDENMNKI